MLSRLRRAYRLYAPPAVSPEGTETAALLGTVSASVHVRSSLETREDDWERANETAYLVIDARYAPAGGFVRGMTLEGGGACYRMLTPVCLGRLWSVKCMRVHM